MHQIFDRYLRNNSVVSNILQFSNLIILKATENESSNETSNIIEIKEKLIKIRENNEQMFDEIQRIENRKDHSDYSYEFREDPKKGILFAI